MRVSYFARLAALRSATLCVQETLMPSRASAGTNRAVAFWVECSMPGASLPSRRISSRRGAVEGAAAAFAVALARDLVAGAFWPRSEMQASETVSTAAAGSPMDQTWEVAGFLIDFMRELSLQRTLEAGGRPRR